MKAWRGKEKQEYISEINSEKRKLKQAAGSEDILDKATKKLESHSAETRSLAFLTAFAFGIVISALGIRVFQPLVDPAVFKTIGNVQKALFTGIDTLLTGALLGGGSNGIHKILDVFLSKVDQIRSDLKKGKGKTKEKQDKD